jgi:hypothetical protein
MNSNSQTGLFKLEPFEPKAIPEPLAVNCGCVCHFECACNGGLCACSCGCACA